MTEGRKYYKNTQKLLLNILPNTYRLFLQLDIKYCYRSERERDHMSTNNRVRQLINELADAVRDMYQVIGPIGDIVSVVKSMGGKVVEDSSIDSFSDGQIKRIDSTTFQITVSPSQSDERKNFTIAHELGHLFLHMGFQTNPKLWNSPNNSLYYRNGNSELEYQANEFAAALLMPQRDYEEALRKYADGDFVDTSKIAKYFHVSIDAAANRGKWLGYLRW